MGGRINLFLFCFFGFLRLGEVTVPREEGFDAAVHLAWEDVRVESYSNTRLVTVRIKASKTDPYRQGVMVYMGRAGEELCPVAVVLGYMYSVVHAWPILQIQGWHGRVLTRERFVNVTRRALVTAGFNSAQYASTVTGLEQLRQQPQKEFRTRSLNIGPLGESSLYVVCKNSAGGVEKCGSKNGTGREMQGRLRDNRFRGETE